MLLIVHLLPELLLPMKKDFRATVGIGRIEGHGQLHIHGGTGGSGKVNVLPQGSANAGEALFAQGLRLLRGGGYIDGGFVNRTVNALIQRS